MITDPHHYALIALTIGTAATMLLLARLRRIVPWAFAPSVVLLPYAGVLVTCLVLGYFEAAPYLALPLVTAGLLVSPWLSAVMGVVGWVVLARAPLPGDPWPALVLPLVAAGLGCVLGQYTRDELQNAWQYSEKSVELAQQVLRQQQQVRQLNQALRLSNSLLRRSLDELASAQRETEEARQLKEQFATTVSHELRTPLNVILGFVEVMQRYPEVYPGVNWTTDLRRDVSEIQVSARYLSDLVDDILDLARVQALKMPIRRELCDLAVVIREACDLAARLLADKSAVKLEVRLPSHMPSLPIDRVRIRQVLVNLLANASRFTAIGSITVTAAVTEDEVVVAVADTGKGIAPDQLESIFDDFTQERGAEDSPLGRVGKGLGLAIAKRFVLLHGGRIWAESEVGRGSTFRFSLPLLTKQVATLAPPPASGSPRMPGMPSVVVVDSGDAARSLLGRHLSGYELVPATDLSDARHLVYEMHPHAVIVNASPALADGVDGIGPVPVIHCALAPSGPESEVGLFDSWLVKPVTSDDLGNVLRLPQLARRVLLVDDDTSFVQYVRRALQAQPEAYDVLSAYDGRLALEMARDFRPDVVLLDLALPGLSGYQVARALREDAARCESPAPRIVAVTATQPGLEEHSMGPTAFAVSLAGEMTQEQTLGLVRYCLEQLHPTYVLEKA